MKLSTTAMDISAFSFSANLASSLVFDCQAHVKKNPPYPRFTTSQQVYLAAEGSNNLSKHTDAQRYRASIKLGSHIQNTSSSWFFTVPTVDDKERLLLL